MFLQLSLHISPSFQHLILVLNTVLLIVALIAFEIFYAELPKDQRAQLPYAYPIAIALAGILAMAIYLQVKAG